MEEKGPFKNGNRCGTMDNIDKPNSTSDNKKIDWDSIMNDIERSKNEEK